MNLANWLWDKFGLREGDEIEPSRRRFLKMAAAAVPAVVIGAKLGIIESLAESSTKIFVPADRNAIFYADLLATYQKVYYDKAILVNLFRQTPFLELTKVRQLPDPGLDSIQIFSYVPPHGELKTEVLRHISVGEEGRMPMRNREGKGSRGSSRLVKAR